MKIKKVLKKKIMNELGNLDIFPIGTERNMNNPRLLVWIYKDTEEFRKEFGRLIKEDRKINRFNCN